MRNGRPHRRHRLGGVRLPDDVSREVHRAPDPGPHGAPVGLVPRRRDAPGSGRLRPQHRLRPRAARRAPDAARDRRPATPPSTGTGWRGRASTCRACGWSRISSPPRSSSRPTRTRTRSRPSTRARWRARTSSRSRALDAATIAFVVISPNDPPAMAATPRDCRQPRIPFLYDPSQQVTRLSGEEMTGGLPGRRDPHRQRLRVRHPDPQDRADARGRCEQTVPVLIVTHGPDGSAIHAPFGAGGRTSCTTIPAARVETEAVDPTGVGDTYRAGLLRGLRIGAPWPVAGPHRQRRGGLRPRGPGPPAAPVHAGRVSRPGTRRNFGETPGARRGCSPSAGRSGYNLLLQRGSVP